MLTTCPECRTTFRVTQEHLGLRRGLVRCGTCGVVFNAYDSLLAELVVPPSEAYTPGETAPVPEELPVQAEVPKLLAEPVAPEFVPELDQALYEAAREALPLPPARSDTQAETSDSILLSELPTRRSRPAPSLRAMAQFLAVLALSLLLVLQLALFLRADLAAALPSTRPLLAALCRPLGCGVALPRQLDKAAIAASSLEHDAENTTRARLSLLLANRTGQTQAWPHLVLTLTDVRDAPVAQRVFAPREYLGRDGKVVAGMPAGEEREIRLDLDTGTLAATGYALELMYR